MLPREVDMPTEADPTGAVAMPRTSSRRRARSSRRASARWASLCPDLVWIMPRELRSAN
jgi:hypothetical protein